MAEELGAMRPRCAGKFSVRRGPTMTSMLRLVRTTEDGDDVARRSPLPPPPVTTSSRAASFPRVLGHHESPRARERRHVVESSARRRERERRRTVSIDGAMKAREWIAWMHPPLETGWMSYSVNFNPILGFGFSVGDSLRSQIRPRLFAPASVSRPALSPPDDNLPTRRQRIQIGRLPLFPIPESTNCPPPHHRRPWPPRKQCASAAAAAEQQREKTRGIRELRSILLAAHVVEDTPLSGSPAARGGSPPPPAAPYPTLGVPSPSIRPA
jgi:hypothetical protein